MRVIKIAGGNKEEADKYNSLPKETPVVLLIYADWCGHCQAFKPIWEEIERAVEHEKGDAVLASVEQNGLSMILPEHTAEFAGFPTIRFIQNGKIEDHEGSRDMSVLMGKIREMATKKSTGKSAKLSKAVKTAKRQKGGRRHRKTMRGGCGCWSGGRRCGRASCARCRGGTRGKKSQIRCGTRRRKHQRKH
jgi:thiol-disulfide isomerase/thioredoxin